jgi:hypothetical protein
VIFLWGGGRLRRQQQFDRYFRCHGALQSRLCAGPGDFSYGEKSEAGWCTYIHSFFGNTYPFELLSGNHESDGSTYSGLIDNFTPCLPDRFGNIQGTYAKRFYYDYPAAKPLVRFIMIDPALNFATGGFQDYSAGTANYNWVSSTIDAGRAAGIPG